MHKEGPPRILLPNLLWAGCLGAPMQAREASSCFRCFGRFCGSSRRADGRLGSLRAFKRCSVRFGRNKRVEHTLIVGCRARGRCPPALCLWLAFGLPRQSRGQARQAVLRRACVGRPTQRPATAPPRPRPVRWLYVRWPKPRRPRLGACRASVRILETPPPRPRAPVDNVGLEERHQTATRSRGQEVKIANFAFYFLGSVVPVYIVFFAQKID